LGLVEFSCRDRVLFLKLSTFGVRVMVQSKPTEEPTEKVLAAVLEGAGATIALREVVAAAMKQLRETNP
jgi:hypothetical protein